MYIESGLLDRHNIVDLLIAEFFGVEPDSLHVEDKWGDCQWITLGDKQYMVLTEQQATRKFENLLADDHNLGHGTELEKLVWETIADVGRGVILAPYDGIEWVLRIEPKKLLSFCRKMHLFEGNEWFEPNPFVNHPDELRSWYLYRIN